jgi:Protein of unknown function (DUF2950)
MPGINTRVTRVGALFLIALSIMTAPTFAAAADEPVVQATFDTPQAAVEALVTALRLDDTAALMAVFGPDGEDLVSSGDAVADSNGRARFLAAYDAGHDLVADTGSSYVLEVGDDGWPVPTPIVQTDGKWRFDTDAGIDEVVYRRIGRNELGAIEVCLGLAAAQQDYIADGHDGQPAGIYAQKLVSDPGKRNGLYWEPAEGERASPIGPFIALAVGEGYRKGDGPTPYHGYMYRLLKAQGPAAPGGAKQYVQNGVLSGGFAVVAYPVEYQASGVATFIVSHDGVVYQKDLGANTAEVAVAMTEFNPDSTWTKLDVEADPDEAHVPED